MGIAGGGLGVVTTMDVVGGAGGTPPKPGMPYRKVDGCGEEGLADDGPAALAQGSGGGGVVPTARGGNGEDEGPAGDGPVALARGGAFEAEGGGAP